jgi:hypothetical protein
MLFQIYANYHCYYLFHLYCVKRYWLKRNKERIEAERLRVKKIWEEMLNLRKESTLKEFKEKEKELTEPQDN